MFLCNCRKQAGTALLIVLWLLIVLTVIGLALSLQTRTGIQLAAHHLAETRSRMAAEAGIEYALWRLLNSNNQPARQSYTIDYAEAQLTITVADEAGKIDLNRGHVHLLEGLLRQYGADVDNIRDAILDWRDQDSERRPNGAEARDYTAAGNDYGARDTDFAALTELQHVLGMTPQLYSKLEPHLTIYSARQSIYTAAATPAVLRSVPGLSDENIELYLQRREDDPQTPFTVNQPYGEARGSNIWSITSTATTDQAVHRMRAVIQLGITGAPQPWLVLARFEYIPVPQAATPQLEDA